MRWSATISPGSSPRLGGELPESSPHLSKAVTAIRNSCSGLNVTEQFNISRLGNRGDGIADTHDGPVYVPYTLPGETVTVETVNRHPDRRHLLHVDKPSTSAPNRSANISVPAAAAPCSIGHSPNTIFGNDRC